MYDLLYFSKGAFYLYIYIPPVQRFALKKPPDFTLMAHGS